MGFSVLFSSSIFCSSYVLTLDYLVLVVRFSGDNDASLGKARFAFVATLLIVSTFDYWFSEFLLLLGL